MTGGQTYTTESGRKISKAEQPAQYRGNHSGLGMVKGLEITRGDQISPVQAETGKFFQSIDSFYPSKINQSLVVNELN